MALVRNPALWAGLALIAIGGGNWLNGRVKIADYDAVIAQRAQVEPASSPEEFPNLNERTATTLLAPLRSRVSQTSYDEGKRDFYRVVLTGGRVLVLIGAFLVVAATYWEHRREAATTA